NRLSAGSIDDLVIDAPFQTVRSPQHFVLPLGRRLERADGAFDGVAVVTFEPAELRSFFRSVDIGRDGQISVLHPDGLILFREPSATDVMGQAAPDDPILVAARQSQTGTLRYRPAASDVPVITAFQSTSTPRVVIAVSLSERELLTTWRREAIATVV